MNIGFSPISQRISYTSKSQPKLQEQKPEDKEMAKKLKREYSAGFISGALMASMIAGGIYISNPDKTELVMQDLKAEYVGNDKQNLIIEDVNDDDCPDIVIENKYDKVIYDLANKKVYLDEDGEITEWGY